MESRANSREVGVHVRGCWAPSDANEICDPTDEHWIRVWVSVDPSLACCTPTRFRYAESDDNAILLYRHLRHTGDMNQSVAGTCIAHPGSLNPMYK